MMIKKMYSGCNSAPRLEKKYVEKKRRNNMKNLFNQLYSLLPLHPSQVIGNSTMVYRRVKELLNGSSSTDDIIETLLCSWDNEIQSEMLGLINLM
ncbi:hypothetical protein MTR67_053658 [Solanum verrucosum]|uniref:BHLH domain-containing protein n=1 Tax=Solanum verrucosum TaxID=315347 RepID=A0AAF1A3U3_SOLVR|nr:hypothetical protein MTR67_053658 [Solanum verrucosum]